MNTRTAVIETNTLEQNQEPILKRIGENGVINVNNLTEDETRKYGQLAKTLNTNDVNSVANFGVELQSTIARQSNDFLVSVRSGQTGEIGTLIDELLGQLSYIDLNDLEEPSSVVKFIRKVPLLRNLVSSIDKIMQKYDSIEKNVDNIAKKIQVTRLTSLRDNNALEVMFNNNLEYIKQLEDLIIAGQIKINELDKQLEEMMNGQYTYEEYQIQDVQEYKNSLAKRINDLASLRYVMKQSLMQIRIVQRNNISIADKAQSIVSTTIPVWRNQLSIAVALNNQKNNIEAQRKVSDTTNTILRKNAELLRSNSIEVAKENERSVISIETLRKTTEELITTIREVKQIHDNANTQRLEVGEELHRLEGELSSNILSNGNHKLLK